MPLPLDLALLEGAADVEGLEVLPFHIYVSRAHVISIARYVPVLLVKYHECGVKVGQDEELSPHSGEEDYRSQNCRWR